MDILIPFRQRLSAWVIRLFQWLGPRRVSVLGRTFRINRHVFNPRAFLTSKFMARHLDLRPTDSVLDMGTGSGIQAIVAAATAARVVAVDINPEAVRLARENARANGVEAKVTVLEGDLFAPVGPERFDAILLNPPYLEGRVRSLLDHAMFDPGRKLHRRFFAEAKAFLTPGGCVLMVCSSLADPSQALAIADELGWDAALLRRKRVLGETLFLYSLTPRNAAARQCGGERA